MKTVTLYTREEIEQKWPTLELSAPGKTREGREIYIHAGRVVQYVNSLGNDHEELGIKDTGYWSVAISGNFPPSSIPAVIEALAKIQQHIEAHP